MARGRLKRQAEAEAQLRYQPTADQLTQILHGLKGDYRQGVKQARSGAKIISEAAKQALPAANALYGASIKGNTVAQKFVASELAGLEKGSPFRAAVAVDQGGARSRLTESKAMTGRELLARRVDAHAGGQQEVRALRNQYLAARDETRQKLLSNASQAGTYTAARLGDLRGEKAKLKVQKRGQTLSHEDRVADRESRERQTQARIEAQKVKDAAKKKPKMATPAQQAAAEDAISNAVAAAKKLKMVGMTRSQALDVMRAGDPKSGIPRLNPRMASVGLDVVFDGHISANNVHVLRDKRKIRVKQLGYPLKAPPKAKAPSNPFVGAKAHT